MKSYVFISLLGVILFSGLSDASGYELAPNLSLEATWSNAYQRLEKASGEVPDKTRGSSTLDASLSFKPFSGGEFFLKGSISSSNGLKDIAPFTLTPNTDDLRSDLLNINESNRNYLQELWYGHSFKWGEDVAFRLCGGLINSASFIDENAFANDELEQFMNNAFVNNPTANLVSYDFGIGGELELKGLQIRAVAMRPKIDGDRYTYGALQIGYSMETSLGEGNYRLYAFRTNKRFPHWEETSYGSLKGFGISYDQELIKETLGAFLRIGCQDDEVEVEHTKFYSGGLTLKGKAWGREDDELALGYALLKAPPKADYEKTYAFEAYLKLGLFKYKCVMTNLTLDFQYIKDRYKDATEVAGYIYGLRFNITF